MERYQDLLFALVAPFDGDELGKVYAMAKVLAGVRYWARGAPEVVDVSPEGGSRRLGIVLRLPPPSPGAGESAAFRELETVLEAFVGYSRSRARRVMLELDGERVGYLENGVPDPSVVRGLLEPWQARAVDDDEVADILDDARQRYPLPASHERSVRFFLAALRLVEDRMHPVASAALEFARGFWNGGGDPATLLQHRIAVRKLIDGRQVSVVHGASASAVVFVLHVDAPDREPLDDVLGWFISFMVQASLSERAVLPLLHEHFPLGPAV